MSRSVDIDQLGEAIAEELTIFSDHILEGVKKETKSSMTRLVKKTKATAPVGHRQKHYRDSITYTKVSESNRGISLVWYVKGSDYRLSHLLENGHALRDGGRVEGTHFIENASEPILEEYLKSVEEVIKNG